MGSYCSCLTSLAQFDSEDLTREANKNITIERPIEIPFQPNTFSSNKHNTSFSKFLSSQQGLALCSNKDKKFAVKLHKFLAGYLIRKKYIKSKSIIEKESYHLYEDYVKYFYSKNEILKKAELLNLSIDYNKQGYKKHYNHTNETANSNSSELAFIPNKKERFDDVVILNYNNSNSDGKSKHIQTTLINIENDDLIKSITAAYIGQVNFNNKPHGYGILFNANKNIIKLQGYWINDQFTGWNIQISSSGLVSCGKFVNGTLNGYGEIIHAMTGIGYRGMVNNGNREGEGTDESFFGVYKGSFVNNMKEGRGVMEYTSGDRYEGEFKQDQLHGQGHYKWSNTGYEYIGEYKEGLMDGKGLYKWNEKEYYKGEFKKGIKEGIGEMKWANGRRFIGPFRNGKPNGKGIFDNGLNLKLEMEFINGKLKKENRNDTTIQADTTLNTNDNSTITNRSVI